MTATTGRRFVKALSLCLIIAGTLDISDALIFFGLRGVSPKRLLQNIASALAGPQAFHGGLATALLGLAIHYAITFCWATLFLFAATRFAGLTRHAVISGLLYGGLIYVVMDFVVLALTRLPPRQHHLPAAVLLNGVLALLLFQGLPIALIAQRYLRE